MKLNYDFGRPMLVEQQVRRERTCRTSLFRKLRKPRKDEFRAARIRGIFETGKSVFLLERENLESVDLRSANSQLSTLLLFSQSFLTKTAPGLTEAINSIFYEEQIRPHKSRNFALFSNSKRVNHQKRTRLRNTELRTSRILQE
mgnify:CR=1 FL=1